MEALERKINRRAADNRCVAMIFLAFSCLMLHICFSWLQLRSGILAAVLQPATYRQVLRVPTPQLPYQPRSRRCREMHSIVEVMVVVWAGDSGCISNRAWTNGVGWEMSRAMQNK
jgi:hypothetical protein